MMEAINHLMKLRFFKQSTPYMLLQSLDYLRKRKCLPPLWLTLEERFLGEWRRTELFGEWQWKSSDETKSLFDIWSEKININTNRKLPELKSIVEQSELLEDELNKILSSLNPPTTAMLSELDEEYTRIKRKLLNEIYEYYDL